MVASPLILLMNVYTVKHKTPTAAIVAMRDHISNGGNSPGSTLVVFANVKAIAPKCKR
jgi:hypothetical protein